MPDVTVQISPELWCGHRGPYETVARICAGKHSDTFVKCLADVAGEPCGREYLMSEARAYQRSSTAPAGEDRCKHELLRADCGDCRPKPARQRRAAQPVTPPGAFQARYAGRCAECRQDIEPGQWITRAELGYAHATCPD